MEGIIYKYTSPSNKVYIGQTINESKRKNTHKNAEFNNDCRLPYFYNAIRKYGFNNFKYEVIERIYFSLEERDSIYEKLNSLEEYYISFYKSNDLNFGYNITKGGNNVSPKTYKKVNQYSLDGKFIKSYMSIAEASRDTGIYSRTICACCNKEVKSAGGYYWGYFENDNDININNSWGKRRKIFKYDLNNNLIKIFNSVTEAAKELKIDVSYFAKIVKEEKIYKNYIWKFK